MNKQWKGVSITVNVDVRNGGRERRKKKIVVSVVKEKEIRCAWRGEGETKQ